MVKEKCKRKNKSAREKSRAVFLIRHKGTPRVNRFSPPLHTTKKTGPAMPGNDAPILPGLWELEPANYGESELERATRESIAAIDAETGLDRTQLATAQVAIELARNISAGNRKGRAVANEAAQLVATLDALGADETAGSVDALPDDVRKLLNVLESGPIRPAPASNTA